MRKGKALTESEITLTIGQKHGQRTLIVSRPRLSRYKLAPEQLGVLQLSFDSSGLCPPFVECSRSGPKGKGCSNSSCKALFDVLNVPLQEEVTDGDALRRGRQVIDQSFTFFRLEADKKREKPAADRARHSSATERIPHRAFAPARTEGSVGQRK